MDKALFISFEGIDGSGKSTQARRLAAVLRAHDIPVVLTREPGGSAGAEEIRALILTGDADRWSPETELLLFVAARRDHIEKTVLPALAKSQTVITDRFADSTRVYQGAVRGDLRQMVDTLHALMVGIEPDLTIILDLDPKDGLNRSLARMGQSTGIAAEDRFEAMGLTFQVKLRAGYQEIVRQYPKRCRIVSAEGTKDEVFERIWSLVEEKLNPL